MNWNQINGTIAPSLNRAKQKANDLVRKDEVAIISKDIRNWWKIRFYDYDNGPKIVVEDSVSNNHRK